VKLKGQNGVLSYSKNQEKDAGKLDALERNGNFYLPFSFANRRAIRKARKYEKSLVADSDGHHPKDIGKTYNIFSSENINYKSEKLFRDSINENVREGNFEYQFRPIPIYRVFHHALMIVMNYFFRKKK
jgi:predicted metal-dependent phosphoesterase TrpH